MRCWSTIGLGLALTTGSCFKVEPLADCSRQDGLYLPYHVCVPPAREPLQLGRAPRDLVVGDFDADGQDDDVAVLYDRDAVTVHVGLDEAESTTLALSFTGGAREVGGILATSYLGDGLHGDDLFAWAATSADESEIVALPNGGDMFAGAPIVAPLRGRPLTEMGVPTPMPGEEELACVAPNGGLALEGPLGRDVDLIIVTCVPDVAEPGLPDAIVIAPEMDFGSEGFGAFVGEEYRSVGAAQLALLDEASGLVGLVFAHRPDPAGDAEIAVVKTPDLENQEVVAIQPRQGAIDQIRVADLDLDDDVDLLAIHLEKAGFSIVRQEPGDAGEPAFSEPEFYTLDLEISDVVLGDFTGDGGLDIVVAHNVDNTSLDGITLFALDLTQPGGPEPYNEVLVGTVEGAIVALRTMHFDGDGVEDLAVAVRDGSRGSVNFYVNLSPGDE